MPNHLVLITGLSGAGKSNALDAVSDLGYYFCENLPLQLIPEFAKQIESNPNRFGKSALLLDIDCADTTKQFFELLPTIKSKCELSLIYLDATNEVIIRRYSETRRPHPRFDPKTDKNLENAIQRERALLIRFKEAASIAIDTSSLTVHDLKRKLEGYIKLNSNDRRKLRVNFVSFGFKHGAPIDCDLIVDIRFLPNPHFDPALKDKTGLDPEVQNYVMSCPDTNDFLTRYTSLLQFLLPKYAFEGKSYLNIGIGCTGGKHRSIVVANKLAELSNSNEFLITVNHRDISR